MVSRLFGLIITLTLVPAAIAAAQSIVPPSVPAGLEPPSEVQPFLMAHAEGTQNYTCLSSSSGFTWSFFGPQATLFDEANQQVIDPLPQSQSGGGRDAARDVAALGGYERGLGGGDRELHRSGLRRLRRDSVAAAPGEGIGHGPDGRRHARRHALHSTRQHSGRARAGHRLQVGEGRGEEGARAVLHRLRVLSLNTVSSANSPRRLRSVVAGSTARAPAGGNGRHQAPDGTVAPALQALRHLAP